MKLIIFFIFTPFVYSDIHRLMTTYTGISGATTPGTPEFSAVTTLDGQQIDYYDSNVQKLIPRQDWMRKYESQDQWKGDTVIRKEVQQIYKINIIALMKRFNQTRGVHVYQRMYGCQWDNETGLTQGFDEYGYDGEDFIMLDLKESRYITPVQQGVITVNKWNENGDELGFLQDHFKHDCISWMQDILKLRKAVTSRVSLLYDGNPSAPVVCHATGFYTSRVNLIWLKNGEEYLEKVEVKETRSNGDGTFNRSSVLRVSPDEWRRHKYVCEVEHMGKTIRKSLTKDEIESNKLEEDSPLYDFIWLIIIIIFVACICVIVYCISRAGKKQAPSDKISFSSAKESLNKTLLNKE